jgi:hypothetical protein
VPPALDGLAASVESHRSRILLGFLDVHLSLKGAGYEMFFIQVLKTNHQLYPAEDTFF